MFLKIFLFIFLSLSLIAKAQDTISLNGEWNFQIDSLGKFDINSIEKIEWRKAIVPLSWNAQFEDLRDYLGVAWYKKKFTINHLEKDKVFLIKFGAVNYSAEVFINKIRAGKHEGGYTPFQFDITSLINEGENEIIDRVLVPANNETGTEGLSFWHIPHGKQTWYVHTGGIWQNVELIKKPSLFIEKIFITPDIDGTVIVKGIFNKKSDKKVVDFKIIDPDGKTVLSEKRKIDINNEEFSYSFKIENPKLWHFDSPNLYTLKINLSENALIERFGFRSIEAKNKKLYLNGKPFYLIAALDQDFYPETIYTTPSEEYIRDEMLKAKKLGLNMLRCHIKAPDPLYLKVADEVGLLIWYELPNWGQFTSESSKRGSEIIDAMLERDWNHPSIIIFSIINESWGIDLQNAEQRKWLLDEFNRVKKKVGKLVVDNSACWGNFHIKTDINDYHTYWAIPDNRENFDETIQEVAKRPSWLFSEFGDSEETGEEPLLISEFGNWGLPKFPEKLPWWINRKFLDIDISLPLNYEKRFFEYKYDEIFKEYDELAEESQRNQFNALKYEIETIRLFTEIQGYVITEFTDINWEANGLLDMWRNFKIYSDDLPLIQQQDIIIPRPVKYNYWYKEEVEIKLFISHYSDQNLDNSILKWQSSDGQSGEISAGSIKEANVTELSSLKIRFNEKENSEKIVINFQLISEDKIIAKNFIEIFLYPSLQKENISLSVYDFENSLKEFSNILNNDFKIDNKSSLILTNIVDEKILSFIEEGKSVICLVDSNTILPESTSLKIISRNEEWYDGNWASNFNWKRNNIELFNNINFSKAFGFETVHSSPEFVISGVAPELFNNVPAGMFISWLHLNSGFIVNLQHGKGKLILCSFPIAENYSSDPFAKILLNNLINFITSKNYKSTLNFN